MAVLELKDIEKIINAGQPDWISEAIREHKRLDVHINGKGTAEYLKRIDGIENPKQLALRKTFLTTNRYVFTNLSRPVDKVFSAKGGGNIYNLNQSAEEETLRDKLSNVRHGKAIRTWIKDIQANKYYTDPAGLVFFEWVNGKTYPTLKSIKSIFNYECDGRVPEWVIFQPFKVDNNDGDFYRVVDDRRDLIVKKVGLNFTEVEDTSFDNPFKIVPAIINSNIINTDLTYNESPFEVIISLADHYLRTGTIKNLNEFLYGYPIFWRYLTDCKVCKGTGYIKGIKCSSCGGTGKNLTKDITDMIQLEIPEKDTDVKLAPDLAGYVTPDIDSWKEMRIEQEYIFSLMQLTLWGSKMAKDANNETATAAFLNVQPVNDQLNNFADSFQDMEKKMTDLIGKFYLGEYKGSSISYGRRFLVEPPDVIWKKYETAREKGSPKVSLDYLLIQFYQSEFANDLEQLTIAQKGIKLEPFIHLKDIEVKNLDINPEDQKAKYYFNEWFKTVNEIDLLTKPIETLQKEFDNYLLTKELKDDSNVQ